MTNNIQTMEYLFYVKDKKNWKAANVALRIDGNVALYIKGKRKEKIISREYFERLCQNKEIVRELPQL